MLNFSTNVNDFGAHYRVGISYVGFPATGSFLRHSRRKETGFTRVTHSNSYPTAITADNVPTLFILRHRTTHSEQKALPHVQPYGERPREVRRLAGGAFVNNASINGDSRYETTVTGLSRCRCRYVERVRQQKRSLREVTACWTDLHIHQARASAHGQPGCPRQSRSCQCRQEGFQIKSPASQSL